MDSDNLNQPGVTVLILNWNGKAYLEQFLPSVLSSTYQNFQVLLVDNGSTDGSVEHVKEYFPEVRLLAFNENLGYTIGNNKGLEQITTPYFVVLNSDVEVEPGWLEPLVETMEADPTIASIQPKLKSFHHRREFEYAGGGGGFMDRWGYPFCQGRMFTEAEEDDGQYDTPREIFWATGACSMIRKSVSDQIGFFEEKFFAHWEEIDFCWRARNYGYKIMYQPKSVVYHVGGGTLSRQNPRKTFLNVRNSLATLVMNVPFWKMPIKIYARLVLDGVWGLKSFWNNEFKVLFAIWRAHWAFYFGFFYWLKRRRQKYSGLKKFHRNEAGIYKGSVVWAHFVKGQKKFSQLDPKRFNENPG